MHVKKKMIKYKSDTSEHKKVCKTIKNNKIKNVYESKHKGGNFVLKWYADRISLFLEIAVVEDCKKYPKKIRYKIDTGKTSDRLSD